MGTCDAHVDEDVALDLLPAAAADVEVALGVVGDDDELGIAEVEEEEEVAVDGGEGGDAGEVPVASAAGLFDKPKASACLARTSFVCLLSFAHSEAGMDGGRCDPRSGFKYTRLPWLS